MNNLKENRLTVRLYIAVGWLSVVLLLTAVFRFDPPVSAEPDVRIDIACGFLSSNGWTVSNKLIENVRVHIPESFGDVYKTYNDIQLFQGFDLTNYKGCDLDRFTFVVVDYDGYEDSDMIRANILFDGNNIVAADICSVAIDGFMHGVVMKENGKNKNG